MSSSHTLRMGVAPPKGAAWLLTMSTWWIRASDTFPQPHSTKTQGDSWGQGGGHLECPKLFAWCAWWKHLVLLSGELQFSFPPSRAGVAFPSTFTVVWG